MPTPQEIASEQEKLYESSSLRDDMNDAEATVLLKWGEAQVVHMAETFPDDFEQKTRFLRQLIKNINRFVGQREFNDKNGQRDYMEKVVKYLEPLGYTASEDDLFAALPTDPKDMMGNLKAIITTLASKSEKPAPQDSPNPAATDEQEIPIIADEKPSIVEFDTSSSQTTTDERKATDEQEMPIVDEALNSDLPFFKPNIDKTEVIPDISHLLDETEHDLNPRDDSYHHNINTTENIPTLNYPTRETEQVVDNLDEETLENLDTNSINQPETGATSGEETENDKADE